MALFEEKTKGLPKELTDKAEEIVDRIISIFEGWHKHQKNGHNLNLDNELVLEFRNEFVTTQIKNGAVVLKTMSPFDPTGPDFNVSKWLVFNGKRDVWLGEYLMIKIHNEEDLWELKKCAFKLI